jgi:hypothetical protein
MFARFAEQIEATGEFDQFRHPVAGSHEGIQPFDAGDGRALRQMAGSRGDAFNAIFQERDHLLAAVGDAERPGDSQDVVPDIGQSVRGEGQNARSETARAADRLLDFGQTDGANFALGLCEDEVGPQLFQPGGVNVIDRQSVLQEGVDLAIDVETGRLEVQLRSSAGREVANGRREITFVRPSDELIAQAKLADDLRAAGQQRNDTWFFQNVIAG